jgi:hypothetical protein
LYWSGMGGSVARAGTATAKRSARAMERRAGTGAL